MKEEEKKIAAEISNPIEVNDGIKRVQQTRRRKINIKKHNNQV